MDAKEKLCFYLKEADIHKDRLSQLLNYLKQNYPLSENSIKALDVDKLDAFVFRFAKLQDLLGSKIFRLYLDLIEFPTQDKSFLQLLKELEKEGIVDIDRWADFRSVRNAISHDYPYEEDDKVEAINYLIQHVEYLFSVVDAIRDRV